MNGNRGMPPLPKAPEKSGDDGDLDPKQPPPPVAKPTSKSIAVIALGPGFYKQGRKVEGDKFTVDSFDKLGSWMECVDPVMQKRHLENQQLKREAKRKMASGSQYRKNLADDE